MEALGGLLHGLTVVTNPINVLYVAVGVLIGTLVGVLPGLGPTATMAIILPITYTLSPATALIMLAGVYYGAMYGGSTSSILLNIPGEAASVITAIDGYQMARQGRAGSALGIAAIGSFVAATISLLGLTFLAPEVAKLALGFGPPEYTAITLLGLLLVTYMSSTSTVRSVVSALFGLLVGTIGLDVVSGAPRFTFGIPDLLNGFDFAIVAMGVFGLAEILTGIEGADSPRSLAPIKNVWPTLQDLVVSKWAVLRGSILGFFIGLLPGGGSVLSSLASYAVEKRLSKHPERFGQGAIEGVAGPESANNAGAVSSFIPLLTLGVPGNSVMAMMFAALLIHGITPGPFLIREHADVFWGLIASMYIGNLLLLVLNLPMVGLFVQLLRVPFTVLAPIALAVTLVGAFSVANSTFDLVVLTFFGAAGYFMRKFGYDAAAFVLAFVIGPLLERSVRQSLLMSNGDLSIFVTRPVAAGLLCVFVVLLALQITGGAGRRLGFFLDEELADRGRA